MNYFRFLNKSASLLLVAVSSLGFSSAVFAEGELSVALPNPPEINPPEIKGEVAVDVSIAPPAFKTPAENIDDLVQKALIERAGYALPSSRKFLKKVRDMAQFATTYKGFESSSEAADIILSEKCTLKSAHALEYVKQKEYDSLHTQITSCVFEIAMGLGTKDPERREQIINAGSSRLKELVGEKEAQNSVQQLTSWADGVKGKARITANPEPWDVFDIENKSVQILAKAMEDDATVKIITAKLHKYNHHSNLSRVSSKVINASLSIAALTPTFVSPAAQVAQFIYIAATGGPEEAKLLKEIYLDRRMEARFRRISKEANLALSKYNLAMVVNNPVLLACSESFITNMAGSDLAAVILPNNSAGALASVDSSSPDQPKENQTN